jgi:putative PIN family toxin of toxin-antitoxin system
MLTSLDKCDLFVSEHILEETAVHLADKFRMPTETVLQIIAFLRTEATLIEPASIPVDACRDSDDLPVLGTAQAAEADYLVSGDKDLLVMEHFGKTEIITPRQLYEILRA